MSRAGCGLWAVGRRPDKNDPPPPCACSIAAGGRREPLLARAYCIQPTARIVAFSPR